LAVADGVVQWWDAATGEARIVGAGQRYTAQGGEVEPAARVPGARVRFSVDRHGGDRAVKVRLRRGARVAPAQRRFGDRSGQRSPDAKGPIPVVERWAAMLSGGRLDDVGKLYDPAAALDAGGTVWVGPRQIRRYWQSSTLLGGPSPESIHGEEDGSVRVRWPHHDAEVALESRLRVRRGEIVEQRHGEVETLRPAIEAVGIEVSSSELVNRAERSYAADKIAKVLDKLTTPVLHAGIRLDRSSDPARERPVMARVSIDLDGEPIRAHVDAPTMSEAVDLLEARLQDRLQHRAERRRALRRRGPTSGAGEWRHGDLPNRRAPTLHRPPGEGHVVRRKTYAPVALTVDEAIEDLDALDYDFFLFTDLATGHDTIVARAGGSYELRYLYGALAGDEPAASSPVVVDPRPAPVLTLEQARQHLDLGDEPWIFFQEPTSGRGHVLYRRRDGHHGLLTPHNAGG
jgi:ribosome-associated translation inhibitor RaiA